ncbi:cleavage and polyadenylation specificity factor, putative [Bodo saltans]|uniref:Cleavage and polyadenylation specificity factor, putative n=1 Tax=Bodo saltans TaxID=75058 RepID=A0A0S4J9E5_BODSA|nr:cleavage and polyadenylation specificity factor, putative [Bodo saltans]|eukprot:CUG87984.1 cleavage and polyadenylation specificity factor, putative [Bodo saltans]
MEQYIVAAIGGTVKVLSLNWEAKKFAVHAFLFSGLYVSSLSSIHNILLLGDLHRSITLARFVEAEHIVEVLARHSADVSVVANGFAYRGDNAGFLVTDDQRHLLCLGYQPQVRADGKVKETRLSLESGCRVAGGSIASLTPMRCVGADGVTWADQNKVLYTTNYGEIGFVLPVSEQDFRILQWLSKRLNNDVAHAGGLPPALFHAMDPSDRGNSLLPRQRIISTSLLEQLQQQFHRGEKSAICAGAGTTVERVQSLMCGLKEEGSLH